MRMPGEKTEVAIKTRYIDETLLDFSGYIAVDMQRDLQRASSSQGTKSGAERMPRFAASFRM